MFAACSGDIHKDIYGNIHVVVNRNDAFVKPAAAELERYGVQALPQIETALHAANPDGRLRLVNVVARIKQTETVPLLRHLGLFDADERVRRFSENTLQTWAATTAPNAVSKASTTALSWLRDNRSQGLGPILRTAQ